MAISVNDSVVIARPVPEVFAYVADHENLPAWTVGVKESQRLTAGPPANGATYRVVGKLLGRSVESSYQITAFDRDRGFEGTMTSPMFGFCERYRFESDQDATRVSMSAAVRRQVKADHRRLKTLLEHP